MATFVLFFLFLVCVCFSDRVSPGSQRRSAKASILMHNNENGRACLKCRSQ